MLGASLFALHGFERGLFFLIDIDPGVALYHARFGFTSAVRQRLAVGQGATLRASAHARRGLHPVCAVAGLWQPAVRRRSARLCLSDLRMLMGIKRRPLFGRGVPERSDGVC